MPRQPTASLGFKKENASVKTTFGTNVLDALDSAGDLFPNLPVALAALLGINTGLASAIAAKVEGGRSASIAYKAALAAWNTAFTSTAKYVSVVAAGEESIIVAGGFIPTKTQTQPLPKPGPVTSFRASTNGSNGGIFAGSQYAVVAAKAFLISAVPAGTVVTYENDTMIITLGEQSIYLKATTRKEAELDNMPSGLAYTVSMFAINAAGRGPASAGLQVIPQ